MRRFLQPAWAVLVLGGFLCAPLAADLQDPALDDVLAKYYKTHGGLEKMKSLNGWKMSGKIRIAAQGLEMPLALWRKGPNKMRVESTFQGHTVIQAFDGQRAWWIMPLLFAEAQEMPAEQGRLFRDQADFENPLIVYKEKGYKLELLGREEMDGAPVLKLLLTKADGKEIRYFLDAESGLELRTALTLKSGEIVTRLEVLYGDYKAVDGHRMPFAIENKLNGQTQMQMVIEAIEINPVLEDAFFAMPEKKETPQGRAR